MISINTVRLGEHLPLLDLLPADAPIAWVRGGDGLVGWGVHASTTVAGPNRLSLELGPSYSARYSRATLSSERFIVWS